MSAETRLTHDPERGCPGCPFQAFEEHEGYICTAAITEVTYEDAPEYRAPDWCPLRRGPVVVQLAEGV